MAAVPNDPSVGIDAATGGTLTGWDHVVQSLGDIFLTRFGARVMREWYGSFVPGLLGRNLNRMEVVPFFTALSSAIEQWEPRFKVTSITPVALDRGGHLRIYIAGDYRPRACYGDFTSEGARRISVNAGADGLAIEQRLTA